MIKATYKQTIILFKKENKIGMNTNYINISRLQGL